MSLYYRGRDYETNAGRGLSADRELLRLLWRMAEPVRLVMGSAFVIMLVDTALDLARPYMMKIMIDQYVATNSAAELDNLFVIYLVTIVGSLILSSGQSILLQTAGQRVIFELRDRVFHHQLRQPVAVLEAQPVGRIVTRVTNDTEAVKDLYTDVLVAFASDLVTLLGIVIVMLLIDWRLALASFSILPLMGLVAALYQRFARKAYRQVREKTSAVNSFIQERLNGISVIKAFAAFPSSNAGFRKVNDAYLAAGLSEMRTFAIFRPLVDLLYMGAVLLVLHFGQVGNEVHGLEIGVVVAFLRYMEKFFWPIKDMAEKYSLLQSALAAAERLRNLIAERPEEKPEPETMHALWQPPGRIEFEDVWFAYEAEEWVLSGVSFSIESGSFCAVVGLSGSGKTTLVSLLLGFYEPQRGRILLDGEDIRDIPANLLRQRMAVVFQDVHIFRGTVAENISLYKRSISGDDISRAVRMAKLDEFVAGLPQGEQTQAGYLGSFLSGGQRQLLSLARAMVGNADVLVLDEATSSIDSRTEHLIQEAIEQAAAQRTLFVVAHRLSTIRKADNILVMHAGQIVETGNHAELLARNGIYARLARCS
jgi:ATP-binding cassette subfamily B protein